MPTAPDALDPRAERLLAEHRERLQRILQHPLRTPAGPPVSAERLAHLCQQAEELYWNELAWEQLTGDEGDHSRLVELMFPGLLAFVDGLLLRETNTDSAAPAMPRPAVVERILQFLAERSVRALEESGEEAEAERLVTGRLIDLVLYRLHSVPVQGTPRLVTDDD
ncbi:MAG TPA: hypothetical protein VMK65_02435 [Longimicrobiales bacterium]|nr:hypothetical protein [Longimicrobiales bacterium]